MTVSVGLRFDILQRDNFTCRYCGKQAHETELEVDHVHPRSRGGSDDPRNLVTTCWPCNRGKGARPAPPPVLNEWTSLVGKGFVKVDESARPQALGVVLSDMGDGRCMVELRHPISGLPFIDGTWLVHKDEMVKKRGEGGWCFAQDGEAARRLWRQLACDAVSSPTVADDEVEDEGDEDSYALRLLSDSGQVPDDIPPEDEMPDFDEDGCPIEVIWGLTAAALNQLDFAEPEAAR